MRISLFVIPSGFSTTDVLLTSTLLLWILLLLLLLLFFGFKLFLPEMFSMPFPLLS